jgi:uncharacterized protein YdhG (YjbR/CyaY superfamily)
MRIELRHQMKINAANVDEYVQNVPENRRDAIEKLRALCRKILVGYDETLEYGMPAYSKNGTGAVAFANQKNYISLYVLKKPVVDRHRAELPANAGKGCIRYSSPAKMNFDVIEQMLRETLTDTSTPCE